MAIGLYFLGLVIGYFVGYEWGFFACREEVLSSPDCPKGWREEVRRS